MTQLHVRILDLRSMAVSHLIAHYGIEITGCLVASNAWRCFQISNLCFQRLGRIPFYSVLCCSCILVCRLRLNHILLSCYIRSHSAWLFSAWSHSTSRIVLNWVAQWLSQLLYRSHSDKSLWAGLGTVDKVEGIKRDAMT